jgi:hypothetical protein
MEFIKDYYEKLKDPRWQRKRLEIFERDKWSCQICHSIENTLTVHHIYYKDNLEPWDYPNELLLTTCELCHDDITLLTSEYSMDDLFGLKITAIKSEFHSLHDNEVEHWNTYINAIHYAEEFLKRGKHATNIRSVFGLISNS